MPYCLYVRKSRADAEAEARILYIWDVNMPKGAVASWQTL